MVNHDARVMADHRSLGATASGTPVYIDRRFLDAELHITLGFIEPHWMLGFSGGRKLIAPGLAAQQTIQVLHSPCFMREPLANEGSVEGNPLHAELLEVVRMARHDFLLDVALTQQRAICGVFAGAPEPAHAAGVDFVRSSTITRVPQFFDAAIASAAGHPLDLTFYQSLKGIHAAHHIVRPGGKILLLCECAEGIGSPEFAAMLRSYAGRSSSWTRLRARRSSSTSGSWRRLRWPAQNEILHLHSRRFAEADRRAGRALLLRCEPGGRRAASMACPQASASR